jgi:hypothetical protein
VYQKNRHRWPRNLGELLLDWVQSGRLHWLITGRPASLIRRYHEINSDPVGAHEHREAAIAVYQKNRNRCLAALVPNYRKALKIMKLNFLAGALTALINPDESNRER